MAETAHKQTIYSLTWIYRVDPAFHRLPGRAQDASKAAFLAALEARDPSVTLRGVYSLAGLASSASHATTRSTAPPSPLTRHPRSM
jgi:hypothetical protein